MADMPSRRRRFQFRLRTLMIVVTTFCLTVGGCIANTRRLVKERQDYLNSNRMYAPSIPLADDDYTVHYYFYAKGDRSKGPSAIRLLLGDHAQTEVCVDRASSEEKKRVVANLFPEADIRNWP